MLMSVVVSVNMFCAEQQNTQESEITTVSAAVEELGVIEQVLLFDIELHNASSDNQMKELTKNHSTLLENLVRNNVDLKNKYGLISFNIAAAYLNRHSESIDQGKEERLQAIQNRKKVLSDFLKN